MYIIRPSLRQLPFLTMAPPRTLVIVPVRNEALALPGVIAELQAFPELDVLIVDDCSTDASRECARGLNVQVLPLPLQLGAWGAMQTGMRYAWKHGYQQVITMDGDGQHHGQEIQTLLSHRMANPDVDVLIGSCVSRGSRLRRAAWHYFRALTGLGVSDITSGFRRYSRRAVELLISQEATLLEYQDVGVLLLLQQNGLKIQEVDVCMTTRRNGKSRVYSSWLMVGYYMLVTTVLSISKLKALKTPQG